MRHRGLQQRRRIGEAGGLQHDAVEVDAAVVEIAQQVLERGDEIAAQRAAQAAALQQHHVVVDGLDQQMVEPDLAELVDDDGGAGERGIVHQAVEQRGLAGAEEAGQHGERNGFGRALQAACAGVGHCLAAVRISWPASCCGGLGLRLGLGVGLGVVVLAVASLVASFGAAFFAAFFLASGARPASVVTGVAVDECASVGALVALAAGGGFAVRRTSCPWRSWCLPLLSPSPRPAPGRPARSAGR